MPLSFTAKRRARVLEALDTRFSSMTGADRLGSMSWASADGAHDPVFHVEAFRAFVMDQLFQFRLIDTVCDAADQIV